MCNEIYVAEELALSRIHGRMIYSREVKIYDVCLTERTLIKIPKDHRHR